MEWLAPWESIDKANEPQAGYCAAWVKELALEVGSGHVLFGHSVTLIGRRFDTDDALFLMPDGRVAEVHLTWRTGPERDPAWPWTAIYDSLKAWAEESMSATYVDREALS